MSVANLALLQNLGLEGYVIDDDQTAGGPTAASTTQAGGTAVVGSGIRVVKAVAGASVVMKSVLGGDAGFLVFVINDSANSINSFPAPGEQNNGVNNAVLAVPAGQSALYSRVSNSIAGVGAVSPGWRSAVIP